MFNESFNQKRKIKLLHVKIKKFKNFIVQTIFVKMHILILVSDLKLIANLENDHQLNFISFVYTFQIKVKVAFMINIKVSKQTFVNRKYVKFYKFLIARLRKLIKLRLTDNKLILNIFYMIQLTFNFNDHIDTCWYLITNLSKYNDIVNIFWLQEHDSQINFVLQSLTFNFDYDMIHCLFN